MAGVLILLLTGCAGSRTHNIAPHTDNVTLSGEVGDCARWFSDIETSVVRQQTRDAQASIVPGYPYLRVNRFLSAVANTSGTQGFERWVDNLVELDREARHYESTNLTAPGGIDTAELIRCGDVLRTHDLNNTEAKTQLRNRAQVPTSYQKAHRVLGLYPVTALGFSWGIRNLHAEQQRVFDTPTASLPVSGHLRRYVSGDAEADLPASVVADILAKARDNTLGTYAIDDEHSAQLFRHFAPTWEVDVVDTNDELAAVRLDESAKPDVDVNEPTVYTLLSQTLVNGKPHLQLNYTVWFAARPVKSVFDLLGGQLDGITWRVTLDHDGTVLMFDAIHNCGCYHVVLPTPALRLRTTQVGFEEPLFVPKTLPTMTQPVIRLSSGAHYIQDVYAQDRFTGDRRSYEFASYNTLRSINVPGSDRRKNLFDSRGIVVGTERAERWFFWPMGVVEPGAMRQWGTHAIAFVGERHFDDGDWIDRYFYRAP